MLRSSLGTACLILLVGCEKPEQTLEEVQFTPPIAVDTAVVDTIAGRARDSILGSDTLVQEAPVAMDAFSEFLCGFQAAVRSGEPARVSSMTRLPRGSRLEDSTYSTAFEGEMGTRFLSAEPSDFERAGTERRLTLHVGYDREGKVVLPEEAYTETSATLTFDRGAEGYRLVRVDVR